MSNASDPRRDANERAIHNRLILALEDLEEARSYALYLVPERKQEDRTIVDALNAALVVAYGRCFSGESGSVTEALPAVPDRFLKALDPRLRALHDRLMVLRHREFAHSDADAAAISMTRWVFPNETFVGPDRRMLRVALGPTEIEIAIELISSLRVAILEEVARIQARFKSQGEIPTQHIPRGIE